MATSLALCTHILAVCAQALPASAAGVVKSGAQSPAGWQTEQLGVVPRIAEPLKFESPDGCHLVAVSVTADDERQVFVDGKPGPKVAMVKEDSLRISADGQHTAYIAGRGDYQYAVIDGKPGPQYGAVANISFSADGKRVVYAGLKTNKQCVVVLDGVEGAEYEAIIADSPLMSLSGTSVAYGARKDGKWRVWLNGKEGSDYDRLGHLVLSSNGATCVYQARRGGSAVTVINGLAGPPQEGTGSIAVSPDGKRVAYVAWKEQKCRVVVDNKPGIPSDGLVEDSLGFSPDGKRFAYKVGLGGKRVAVIDGKPGPEFDGMAKGPMVWSSDGKRVGYQARRSNEWLVVIDAKESSLHEGLSLNSPVFGPDGKSVAFGVVKADRWTYVINNTNTPAYDALGSIAFSQDGRHVAYSAKSGKAFVCVNGQNSPPYKTVACGPVFRRDGIVEFLALDDQDRLIRVTRTP